MRRIRSIRYKILVPTAIVLVVICLLLGLSSFFSIRSGMVFMGVEEAQMAAKAAGDIIDGDLVSRLEPGCEDSKEYQMLLSSMREVQKGYGIAFLYTLYTDGKRVYYGVDTDESDAQMKVGEAFELDYEDLKSVFGGRYYAEEYIDHTDDGDLISVYRPIQNGKGEVVGVLGCDYDASGVVSRLNRLIFQTVLFAVVCMAVALVLIGFIVDQIMKNLNAVNQKICNLVGSDGDLTKQLEVHTGDELEDIANNVNTVLSNICDQADIAKKVADGNLTVRVFPKSEKDLLGNALKQLVERNRSVLQGIHRAAAQAKEGAAHTAKASQALAQGTTQQASAVEQITAEINGVARKTKQNAKDADIAAGLMRDAVDKVNRGNRQMKEMTIAMEDINRSSEDISKINKVVEDIAFQTNILALNASVEAARAGAAGKGFAVVAEEVRKLAVNCAEASAQTSALIEDSRRKVDVGADIAGETAGTLEEITKVVQKSGEMVSEIAKASNEQIHSIMEIDQAIDQVSQAVQSNSAASEECAAASEELSGQMVHVETMLSQYKLS